MAGIALGGAARQGAEAPVADVVRARAFEVVDELGTVRLIIGANTDGAGLSAANFSGPSIVPGYRLDRRVR